MRTIEPGIAEAIATLPNGTPLQEILLADGLAKLNLSTLEALPDTLVFRLQQAEATAKRQKKNVWSDQQTTSPQ